MAGRKIKNEADARACLGAVKAAGVERVAWSRANGIDARSLNAWRVALERRAISTSAAANPKLVELVPRGRNVTSARYVLTVCDSQLEFDDACSGETIARVVRALRAC